MRLPATDLTGKRVLVTGGTGFIGGRLAERLVLEFRASVCALVPSIGRLSRISRLPIEFAHGDVRRLEDVVQAAADCDVIFHCAYGNRGSDRDRRRVTFEGTRNVVEAARRQGARRLVHVSTMMVYGEVRDGELDETAPHRYVGEWYPDSKIAAEKLVVRSFKRGDVPATIVQPTVVYGPYSPPYTVGILRRLLKKRIILVNGGEGLCNAVYIDDLISAMLLAAVRTEAIGESFLVSGEVPVTWRDFFGSYERMLGIDGTVSMSPQQALAYYRQCKKEQGTVRRLLRAAASNPHVRRRLATFPGGNVAMRLASELGGGNPSSQGSGTAKGSSSPTARPIHPLPPSQVKLYQAKQHVRIDKAKRLLGYEPAFDLGAGMDLTANWAAWANLVGRERPTSF